MQMEGKRLSGRYEILNRIGGGGMAVVYKAKDMSLHRNVAVKVLSESLSNDSEFIRRFSREAQAAASLSHPNIVNVYDVGRDGYTHFIVMELVEGPTLKQYIQEQGPLSVEEAAEIAIQICDGLSNAHENGIVHRDIKPHNILLGSNGRVKVTDFGIARAASSSTITQTGSVMGSVHYFSPEQARGGVITEKSDIYSLGVVLYEMLTGQIPFDGDSAIAIALQHLQEPVVDPRSINPEIPDNIVKILLRSLEKDPEMRYTSVRAMMQDIRYALQMGHRNEFTWGNGSGSGARTKDFYATVPLTEDTHLPKAKPKNDSKKNSNFREANQGRSNFRGGSELKDAGKKEHPSNQNTGRLGLTKSRIEELRNIPVGDQTVLQRTVVWLDDVQQKLPWWQKAIFGLISFVLSITIAIWLFNTIIGLVSGNDGEKGNTPQVTQESATQFIGKQYSLLEEWAKKNNINLEKSYVESDKEAEIVVSVDPKNVQSGDTATVQVSSGPTGLVPDFTGMMASTARDKAAEQGLTLFYDGRHCGAGSGKVGSIMETDPAPGQLIPSNKTIYAWQNVGHECSKKPPSQGGKW